MTEFLGSQRVNRSAHAVKEATATTIYLGVCPRDDRPVRFDMSADLGPTVELPCFAGCTLPVKAERLHAVTTHLECDGSCRGARGPVCSCGCGGINHANVWTRGALLDHREIVESEIARYRAEQVKIAERREAKREAAARAARSEYDRWAAGHQDLITALEPWYEHRDEYGWGPRHWGAIYDLALSDRMPLAEELSTRYAKCLVCGHSLKAAKSVKSLIGPVCRKYFGPVTGEAAA